MTTYPQELKNLDELCQALWLTSVLKQTPTATKRAAAKELQQLIVETTELKHKLLGNLPRYARLKWNKK